MNGSIRFDLVITASFRVSTPHQRSTTVDAVCRLVIMWFSSIWPIRWWFKSTLTWRLLLENGSQNPFSQKGKDWLHKETRVFMLIKIVIGFSEYKSSEFLTLFSLNNIRTWSEYVSTKSFMLEIVEFLWLLQYNTFLCIYQKIGQLNMFTIFLIDFEWPWEKLTKPTVPLMLKSLALLKSNLRMLDKNIEML